MAVKPIPAGYHAITPYLVVENASRLIEFLEKAFGAEVEHQTIDKAGTVRHADIRIGDSHLMLSEANPQWPATAAAIYLYVTDCDATYKRAVAAGGTSIMELTNMFYGDRHGGVKNPTGNTWWIATHIEDIPGDELARRAAAMMK